MCQILLEIIIELDKVGCNMLVVGILKGTPLWVWILFVFLILRGIKALNDREMEVNRLFLLPLVFFFWGGTEVVNELLFPQWGMAAMGLGLLVGSLIGWMLWRNTPRLKFIKGTTLIIRPGTSLTLIFIVITFVIKFVMIVCLNMSPDFRPSFFFNLMFGALSGLIDGIFWGGTLNLYFSKREYIKKPDRREKGK